MTWSSKRSEIMASKVSVFAFRMQNTRSFFVLGLLHLVFVIGLCNWGFGYQ